ncbi:MAG: ice-binding family protein [Bacteroidales bacterium]
MKIKLLPFLIIILQFILPKINFGQAPDLGAASGFALFTSTGAFTNLGTTNIAGDIGTNAGLFTGFPPGVVAGQIHVADAASVLASTAVQNAYTYMSSLGGSVLGVTLGNGQELIPGVYNTGAASTLNGDLILNALGNPNAIFIIRIGGAFATAAFSNIILINAASLCNVYWQIGGQFDLGANSVFRGTAIVDGAINLLDASSLFGRGLSRAGAISTHNNIVSFSPSNSGNITGTSLVCQGQTGVVYSIPLILNATNYLWTIPAGVMIVAGANTNSITVDFGFTSSSGNFAVNGSNSCGIGIGSANYPVLVSPLPTTSAIYHQ